MGFLHDLRFAARSFIKTPGITIAATLSIALGIAATTAVFTLVNAVLFKPMPVPHPEQLVALYTTEPTSIYPSGFSYPDYRDYRDGSDVFSDLFVHNGVSLGFSVGGGRTELIWSELVTGNYFTGLGVVPAAGRVLTPGDDRTEGAHPVVVLSHDFWQRRFGGNAGIVGSIVKLAGHEFTIVGVARKGFSGTRFAGFIPDVWVPVSMQTQFLPWLGTLENRANDSFNVNGRLKPGVTIEQATAALTVIADRLARLYPTTNARKRVGMVAAGNKTQPAITVLGYVPIAAQAMLAIVLLVLLIACANVANLLLARASSRKREIAMRLACGASRRRVVLQLLTESMLLAATGGIAGLLLARAFNRLTIALNPPLDFATVDFAYDLALDHRVLIFTTTMTVLTGIVFGLLPALQTSRVDLLTALQTRDATGERIPSTLGRHLSLRGGLAVAQVAVSLALIVAAGVFVRSMQSAQQLDPGFETKNVLLVSVDTGLRGYDEATARRFFTQAVDRIKALPGVQAASMGGPLPLDAYSAGTRVIPESYVPRDAHERIVVGYSVVGPEYFRAMSTPIVAGRSFEDTDTAATSPVIIINETMARRFWPNESALGKRLRLGDERAPLVEIVGIARNGKYSLLGEPPTEYFFLPHAQHFSGQMTMIARTSASPASLATAVQREIAALDPDVPVYGVKTMPMFLDRLLSLPKSAAALVTIFALIALVMAAVGLYGVISYSVARRTKEIGLRIAVGARRGDVMWMVLRHGMTLTVTGIAIGTGVALALTQLTASLLYGVGPNDPQTFIAAGLLIAGIALLASYVPARRAMRLDPSIALRYE
ncbi:MAG TPA: ABC transporter permease [Vicinamibacterales bacterium]|jgi:predicted permease